MAKKRSRAKRRGSRELGQNKQNIINFCHSVHSAAPARRQCVVELERAYDRAARRVAARRVASRLVESRADQ